MVVSARSSTATAATGDVVALTPVNVEQFGGLRLDLDPAEAGLGNAIEISNVELDRNGRLRSRDGYSTYSGTSSTNFLAVFAPATGTSSTSPYVIGDDSGTFRAYDTAGTLIASASSLAGGLKTTGICAIGTPSATYTYASTSSGSRRFDGSAWSSVSLTSAQHLAVTPWDNRLANGRTSGGDSRVHFSDPGAPETYGANNYIDLTPGDGSVITALVSWREFLFAFKSGRFFVFYGTSTDPSGNPIFNYRPVDVGQGAVFGNGTAVAGPDGVYFVNNSGMWRTTGGAPELVSGAVTSWWIGETQPYFAGALPTNISGMRLGRVGDRIWVCYATVNSTQRVMVYDCPTRQWFFYDIPAYHATGALLSTSPGRQQAIIAITIPTSALMKQSTAATTDNGSTFSSRYRSGFSDLGLPGREKTVRQTELVGQGIVTFNWARDMGAVTTSSSANVTLGTAPATARGMHRLAQNGEMLSYNVGSVDGVWQLNRVTPFVRKPRDPAEKSA